MSYSYALYIVLVPSLRLPFRLNKAIRPISLLRFNNMWLPLDIMALVIVVLVEGMGVVVAHHIASYVTIMVIMHLHALSLPHFLPLHRPTTLI